MQHAVRVRGELIGACDTCCQQQCCREEKNYTYSNRTHTVSVAPPRTQEIKIRRYRKRVPPVLQERAGCVSVMNLELLCVDGEIIQHRVRSTSPTDSDGEFAVRDGNGESGNGDELIGASGDVIDGNNAFRHHAVRTLLI